MTFDLILMKLIQHISFFVCLFILTASTKAQTEFGITVSPETSLLIPERSDVQFTSYGWLAGVNFKRNMSEEFFIQTGITYRNIFNDFKSNVTYVSNWVGGPEYTDVNLNTKISQTFIQIPFSVGFNIHEKWALMAGAFVPVLIASKANQTVIGRYSIPKYNGDDLLNQKIKWRFERELEIIERSTSFFTKTNISPLLGTEYKPNPKISLGAYLSYNIFNQTAGNYLILEDYRLITFNLYFIYKIKSIL